MITADACVTEASYLLYRAGGWRAQTILWSMFRAGFLTIVPTLESMPLRAASYMDRFQDQPCDYAHATLLVAAEDLGHRTIFTIDEHFYAYHLTSGGHLQVLP